MNIKVFKSSEFGAVRVAVANNEPYFALTDVCKILELSNPTKVANTIDKDDLTIIQVIDKMGRKQKANAVNESGLYQVIFQSRKPEAKKFKRWVTSEVLPAIRKHGMYATPTTIENMIANPDFAIQLLQKLKEEQEAKRKLEAKLIEVKPKVEFTEAIEKTENSIDFGIYAKIIAKRLNKKIGRNTLFRLLRMNKVLMQNNVPYQQYVNQGWFEVIETTFFKGDKPCTGTKTLVTGKGQVRLYNLVKEIIKNIK